MGSVLVHILLVREIVTLTMKERPREGQWTYKTRDEDPDPVIFGPPDPDPVLFSTDPDPDPHPWFLP